MAEANEARYRFVAATEDTACHHIYQKGDFELTFHLIGDSVLVTLARHKSGMIEVSSCIVSEQHLHDLTAQADTIARPLILELEHESDAHIHGVPVVVLFPRSESLPFSAILFSDQRWRGPSGYEGYALQAREVACVSLGRSMDELAKEV